jgi:hypothetical protein
MIEGTAGGTLPTWSAATTPATTSRPISDHGFRFVFSPARPLAK